LTSHIVISRLKVKLLIMNYENRIVAFIDILAFANIIKNTQTVSKGKNAVDNEPFITELYRVFERIRFLMGVSEPSDDVAESRRVSQFSDSIFISFNPEDESREFKYLLGELLHLHVELARHDILIRGGIAYGPMIHTNEIIFGPALIQAYRIECDAANSPRIILPHSLYKIDSEFNELVGYESNDLDNLISLDEDDFYYLDYFDKCQKVELGIFTNDKEYIEHLQRMQKIITKGLENKDPGIYSKYGWMKSKWNKTIKKYTAAKELEKMKMNGATALYDFFADVKLIATSM